MTLFPLVQVLFLAVIALIVWHVAARRRRGEISPATAAAWLVFWGLAALAVIVQDLATELAHRLGVGRGVDLVIYSALVLVFYIQFRVLVKIEQLQRDLTLVVRQLALEVRHRQDAETVARPGPAPDAGHE